MKTLLISGLSLAIVSLSFSEEEPRKKLVIGKILPEQKAERPPLVKPKPIPDRPRFPKHWGKPPAIQTRDMVKLPGKFGMGSSTLARWIAENLKEDAKKEKPVKLHELVLLKI